MIKKETMKPVSHQQASQLLHNKFVVVLGDSIQRSVYKDLVLLLQKDKYLSAKQLKDKGEMTFEEDCLVEGGCLSSMHNGIDYREVRQFQSSHHLVRFYFVTRIYSSYMQSVLEEFRHGLKPDVVIVNSCIWDISRYKSPWLDDYRENLHKFFGELREILPEETLVIWNLTMPLGERINGGFLVPEIEQRAPQLRYDVIHGNFYSGTLADAYGMDVLDLHFHFRFSLHHQTKDGIHWNALAHRKITSLLLQHIAEAWGVIMPCSLTTVEHPEVTAEQPAYGNATKSAGVNGASNCSNPPSTNYSSNIEGYYDGYREEFYSDSIPCGFLDFENIPQPHTYTNGRAHRPALLPLPHPPVHRHQYSNGFDYRPPHHFEPYNNRHHQQVMKSRHARHHYAPYTNYSSNMEGYYDGYREEFYSDSISCGYLDFENIPQPRRYKNGGAYRPALLPLPHPPVHRHQHANGFDYRPPHHFEPYNNHHHQQVMKSRHARHHYAPYTHHRLSRYNHHGRNY